MVSVALLDGLSRSRPEQKLLRGRKRVYGHFLSRLKSRKSFTLTIRSNLDKITEDL